MNLRYLVTVVRLVHHEGTIFEGHLYADGWVELWNCGGGVPFCFKHYQSQGTGKV
jgi:hypothetical protein